jgi:pimeloyl-ACP methyl ester carboxylesterase
MIFALIHGAYTSPWYWHRVVPLLEGAGHATVVPNLPCDDPEAGIERYVEIVEEALAGTDEDPVVVGSSLGAVTAVVVAARRPVRALVSVCGVIPRPGRAVAEDTGEMTQPAYAESVRVNPDGSTTFLPDAAVEIIFHESDPALARDAASRLRPQAAKPFLEPCPFESVPDVPRTGIVAPEDRLLRPEWCEAAVRERLGVEPTILHGDHGPLLSQPEALTELLLGAAGPQGAA